MSNYLKKTKHASEEIEYDKMHNERRQYPMHNGYEVIKKALIDTEVKKYLDMITSKGYGHDIVDQEKRVRDGIIIANHVNEYDKLKEDNALLLAALNTIKDELECSKIFSTAILISKRIIKETIWNLYLKK